MVAGMKGATLIASLMLASLQLFAIVSVVYGFGEDNMYGAYKWISQVETECEAVSMQIATSLADSFNSFDENTEWDVRIHSDYMTEHLGFANWITSGLWHSGGMTATGHNAQELHVVSPSSIGPCATHFSINNTCRYFLERRMGRLTKY
jgi:hypothetical protein